MRFVKTITVVAAILGSHLTCDAQSAKDKTAQARTQIETARAQVSGSPASHQATVLFLISRALAKVDPKQAQQALEQAFDLLRSGEESRVPGFGALASDIVGQAATLRPEYVEANLPVDPVLRDTALARLLDYRLSKKDLKQALALQKQIPGAYVAARRILQALPPGQTQERADVFANLLLTYKQSAHPYSTVGYPEDLASIIVRFWKDLPAALVREGIDEVLKQASDAANKSNTQAVSTSSPTGTVSFASTYEFRVFQMLPVLKALDRSRAEALERSLPKMRSLLEKYPQGHQSLDPSMRSTPLQEGETRQATIVISPSAGQATVTSAKLEGSRMARQIERDLKDDPRAAIAWAAGLEDGNDRGSTLIRLARSLSADDPELAKLALRRLRDPGPLNATTYPGYLLDAATILISLNDPSEARRFIEVSNARVRDRHKQDSDPDSPNEALKLYWPSTQGWRDTIAVAAKITDEDATQIIGEIPDEEIQALQRVILAGIWLNVPVWRSTSPMVSHRKR